MQVQRRHRSLVPIDPPLFVGFPRLRRGGLGPHARISHDGSFLDRLLPPVVVTEKWPNSDFPQSGGSQTKRNR